MLRAGIHLRPVLYAVLSLTVIRMLPVALALVGARLRRDTIAFMGWFGPRGLASVVFTLLAFEDLHGGSQAQGIAEVATWTILFSVFAHGLSARPLAARYAARLGRAPQGLAEMATTSEADTRRRTLGDRRRRDDRPRPDGATGSGARRAPRPRDPTPGASRDVGVRPGPRQDGWSAHLSVAVRHGSPAWQ